MQHPGEGEGAPTSLKDAAYAALDTLEVVEAEVGAAAAAVTYALLDVASELREANRISRRRR